MAEPRSVNQEMGEALNPGSKSESSPGFRGIWPKSPWTVSETQFFLFLAILIGVFSGLVVVCFRIAIEWVSLVWLGSGLHPGLFRVMLAPSLTGILIALLVLHVFKRVRGSGVNQTKAAVYVFDGYVPFNTVVGKFVTCALAIGSGQSLGPEDPALQMGAGIASKLGRQLRLPREKLRMIAPVGAAAGLAAAFNAPIAAVLFVIEEVIGNWSAGVLGAIILAAVSSVVVMRWFLGSEPVFRIPPFQLNHTWELLAYAVLGVFGGAASLLLLKFIGAVRPRLKALPRWTQYLQPAAAGLLIGLIGIRLPQVMGAGYPIVDQALHDQFTWKMLLILGATKILATGLSFVSGTPGGMFAPTLFIGAMLGGAVGGVEHLFFHRLTGTVGTFALVGMGTLFAGFLRTPITSVFMVIEVSGSYSAVLPVMISNTIAYLISRHYQRVPLFDLLSRQDGMILPSLEEARERIVLCVENAMRSPADNIQGPRESLPEAIGRASASQRSCLMVRQEGAGWRLLNRAEIERLVDAPAAALFSQALPGDNYPPILYPDQPLDEALRLIGDWPFLPVVNRADPDKLEGILSLEDILRSYRESSLLEPSISTF